MQDFVGAPDTVPDRAWEFIGEEQQIDDALDTDFAAMDATVAGVRVKPQAGRAVIFDNLREDGSPDVDSLHAGTPVVRGEKWLATLWIRQRPYRSL